MQSEDTWDRLAVERDPIPVVTRELPFTRRTPADEWTTAASRSPGSRLTAVATFPSLAAQWSLARPIPFTVAGAARVYPGSLSIPRAWELDASPSMGWNGSAVKQRICMSGFRTIYGR